jgi:sensory rhodopsin
MIYWAGALVFGIASIVFAALLGRRRKEEAVFGSHVFVSFITTISYLVLALALGKAVAENGQPIYWTRWLFYIASCSILTLDIARILKRPTPKKFEIALFTGLTMFCGFLASLVITVDRWWFFALSTGAYIGMLYTLFGQSVSNKNSARLVWFVTVTWSLFPVVWVLAPTGFGVFTTIVEAVLYLALDFVTKIAFGYYVTVRYTAGE